MRLKLDIRCGTTVRVGARVSNEITGISVGLVQLYYYSADKLSFLSLLERIIESGRSCKPKVSFIQQLRNAAQRRALLAFGIRILCIV